MRALGAAFLPLCGAVLPATALAEARLVIVAGTRDGVPLTVRRLGPLRIMFPFDPYPELRTQTDAATAVWPLVAMKVR